jgi:molybdenum cofactor cytidylyltransferase
MRTGRYAAIVLAAGLSSRMEEFKPLLPLGGETITDRVISIFTNNGVEVILVTGWRKDNLTAGIKHHDIKIIENPDYPSGMFSSIQAGVKSLSLSHQAFFIMPVDIPLVRPTTIKHLIDIASEYPDRIIYPVFDGVRGHPPLIPSSLVNEILHWHNEGGLKAILDSHSEMDVEIRVPDEYILLDIDNQEDYSTLLERFRKYDIPTEQECKAILDIVGTPFKVRHHCEKVASVATAIAEALTAAGNQVDVKLVHSAAVLHDIARAKPKHEVAGGQMLRDFGYSKISDIITTHTGFTGTPASLEAKVVLLADKYVRDEELVTIEERYLSAGKKYGSVPGIEDKIQQGKEHALGIKEELTTLLGYSPDKIVFR